MAEIEVYVSAAPVRVDVSGAQGPAGIDDPQSAFSTNKASIANDDRFAMLDSASANIPKHTLWSLIKSTLKTYFDSIYHTTGGALGTPASGNLANCTFPTLNQNTTGNAATVTTINGRISAGSNVTLSGSGTAASPYVIAASGGGGGGGSSAWGDLTGVPPEISGTTASFTTEQETKLAGIEEGATADQDLSGLLSSATAASTYVPINDVAFTGEIRTSGAIYGDSFTGYGGDLTSLSAANLSGNIATARIEMALTTPGPIGGTTASTGAFTTVTASGAITIGASTASANKDTGALVIQNGGLGVEGAIFAGGTFEGAGIYSTNVLQASGPSWIRWKDRCKMFSTSAGEMVFRNSTETANANLTLGNLTASGAVKTGTYTVGTTPAHVAGAEILISSVSGATVGAAVTTGGGAMLVKAASNGSAWICTAIIIP